MYIFNKDDNKWVITKDELTKSNFDYLKQELVSTRYYSKCLSGATYLPVNSLNNIYDILGEYKPRNWYIDSSASQYTNTQIPENPTLISAITANDYYTKYLSEYGLTLKTLFTPDRLIKDSVNYLYVDVATTEQINLNSTYTNLIIDNVKLLDNHRLLVKDQISIETLPFDIDPNTYFKGNFTLIQDFGTTKQYNYYNSDNGIYLFKNGFLTKTDDLELYEDCIRFSISVKLGNINSQKQFHLSRLLNGYYPTSNLNEPVEFTEKHNWLLRNQVDYNNLFEINYMSVLKHSAQTIQINHVTYSIPERAIAVGEFGVILNTQEFKGLTGISNIIPNKYKNNLNSITQTDLYYWICGDDGILLKVSKHDFTIEKITINIIKNLKSVSFYNNQKGVIVGDLNTILITNDSGLNWYAIIIDDFDSYYYNKVIFQSQDKIYIVGNTGVFIELKEDISGWSAYKRRISKFIDDYEELLLVDNINDIIYTNINWPLTYNYPLDNTQITDNKEIILLVTNSGNVIIYDLNSTTKFSFLYLEFLDKYDNLLNITQKSNSSNFYFSGDNGIFNFNLLDFKTIGVDNSYSNTLSTTSSVNKASDLFINLLFDYNNELLICGNNSLLQTANYSNSLTFNKLDVLFESRLKSKMLFLDYDVASKLNFFTDTGQYRLPNKVEYGYSSILPITSLKFQPLVYGATAPSFMTQSETNILTYWKDKQKTFEYYSNTPFSETSKVELSYEFKQTNLNTIQICNSFTNKLIDISRLAPSLLDLTANRFISNPTIPIKAPLNLFDIYFYNYIMIVRVNKDFPVSVGDLFQFNSTAVDSQFVVNKVISFTINFIEEKFVYFYIDLNDNIINDITKTNNTITLTNLNNFLDLNQLQTRFNQHTISNFYQLSLNSNLEINAKFNNLTSYYNLATKVIINNSVKEMKYSSGFLKFGYTPTYNILDYLQGLNDSENLTNIKFSASKEYLAMPHYLAMPVSPSNDFDINKIYFNYNGIAFNSVSSKPSNILEFGENLKFEWQSLFIDTFIDIIIYYTNDYYNTAPQNIYKTERLLVLKKYYNSENNTYVVEFDKSINSILNNPPDFIDILSRRSLLQISNDLQELNNIHRQQFNKNIDNSNLSFLDFSKLQNSKISTDSYLKILLSDLDTLNELSAVVYTDYKNELALNITRLAKEYNIKINDTDSYNNKLLIICNEKHELKNNDSVVLEFNGGTFSSQVKNQQYFGYHTVNIVDEYKVWIDINYQNNTIGNDIGYLKYTKSDPFFNFQPIDLIDVGVDKKGKVAIELTKDNLKLTNSIYSLVNIDFDKYRFRLIDGLNIETLTLNYPWILEAEVSNALLGLDTNGLVWYSGLWECGRWFSGTWISGTWKTGDWYDGIWNSKKIKNNLIDVEIDTNLSDTIQSTWFSGRWYNGTWNNGTWVSGRWYNGTWNNGEWYNGIWNDGTWNNGIFSGGIWVDGTWNNGILNCDNEPAYWLNGKWNGGDFENGIWYNGIFEEKNNLSRFGTKAYNSRTANWRSGKWLSGSFYSKIIKNNSDQTLVSTSHRYSNWKTGLWLTGDWYGGIAYNINFQSGTWHGGILEDIQVIGIKYNSDNDRYITVNGNFDFNIGDDIEILNTFSDVNSIKGKYKVVKPSVSDTNNSKTKVYINIPPGFNTNNDNSETGLRIVSNFKNTTWKSGIWSNGVFESGVFEGGIWYNGIFKDKANWM